MISGRYQCTNRPIPIIGKTADTDYPPIIDASLVITSALSAWQGSLKIKQLPTMCCM